MQNSLIQSAELEDLANTLVITLKVEANLCNGADDSPKEERYLISKANRAFNALVKEANNHVKE